jgi:glycosyltransferase involved in cell wall biosynthesis
MIVALDATPLSVSTGGVRRYTEELALALAQNFPDDQYWLLSDQPFAGPAGAPVNLHCQTSGARRWWSWGLPRALSRLRADLFHGTDFSAPYLPRRPSVMTVHDLSPWLDRAWQPSASRVRRRTPILLRAGMCTMVITPSEAVRRAAIERFCLPPDRVAAIPLAAPEHFRPVDTAPPSTPYFLFAGTLEPRKNIHRLIEAWREVRKTREVDLVLAGRARSDFEMPPPEPGLRLLGAVPDEQLPGLYSGATACVYPSLYEGFGLPVLEAMQCGALVITSRDPAITEVTGGQAAIHVEAEDTRALAYALAAAIDAPENFAALRAQALGRARDFSWIRTAQRTREVYDAACRVFSRA